MYVRNLAAADPQLAGDHPCFGCPVRELAVCNTLAQGELAAFRNSGSCKHLGPGDPLCWQGDEATHVYTVTRGALRLSKLLMDGRRQVTGFAFPGDFLGVTMEDEHPFTAEAVCDVELCQFSRSRFDAFVDSHPHMERRLYSAAASELAAARDQLVLLGRKTATERLASFLLEMARHSDQCPGGPLRAMLPMPRNDIADYLGLRIETISRELGTLKTSGLVRMMGVHEIWILDRAGLEQRAAGGQ